MRLPRECYQMQQMIETHLTHLSGPQLTGLVLWVCGAILAGSACQNAVASALSPWGRWNNLRQYLREWLYDGSDRARPCQTELDVSLCFAPLLRWVLVWWRSEGAIVISVVYRNSLILRARGLDGPDSGTAAGTAPAVPQMTVIVLRTDTRPPYMPVTFWPMADGVCRRGPSFPVPIPGLAAEPPSAAPPPNAVAPWPGMWNRRSRGSS